VVVLAKKALREFKDTTQVKIAARIGAAAVDILRSAV